MSLFALLMNRLRRDKNKATGHDPVASLLASAYSFFHKHDYVAARELLLRAVERRKEIQDPSILVWILEALASTWTYTDQQRERAEFFSDYIKQYPNDAVAHSMRAGSLWYSGELQGAIVDYSRAVELGPKYILAHLGRGQVYAEFGEFSKAIEDLDFVLKNIEQAPITDAAWRTSVQAYSLNGKAVAHAGLGDFDRALAEFEESIALRPENAWVYYNRAEAYGNRGDRAQAIADYKLAVRMNDPKLPILKKRCAETRLNALLG